MGRTLCSERIRTFKRALKGLQLAGGSDRSSCTRLSCNAPGLARSFPSPRTSPGTTDASCAHCSGQHETFYQCSVLSYFPSVWHLKHKGMEDNWDLGIFSSCCPQVGCNWNHVSACVGLTERGRLWGSLYFAFGLKHHLSGPLHMSFLFVPVWCVRWAQIPNQLHGKWWGRRISMILQTSKWMGDSLEGTWKQIFWANFVAQSPVWSICAEAPDASILASLRSAKQVCEELQQAWLWTGDVH